MPKHKLDNYDREKLEEAKELITKVYEYHCGDSYMRKDIKRLETIIAKIEYILQEERI